MAPKRRRQSKSEQDPFRIYKRRRIRLVTVRGPDGKAVRVPKTGKWGERLYARSKRWYIDFRDETGALRTRAGYRDKAATHDLAVELVKNADWLAQGLRPATFEGRKRPLDEHLATFERALANKGNTSAYVAKTLARLRAVAERCRWKRLDDIEAEAVRACLADWRRSGRPRAPKGRRYGPLSIEAANHYLRAVRTFCRWAVTTGCLDRNPLAGVNLQKVTDRRERRALSEDEIGMLLEAAARGPIVMGLAGPDRVMLYRLALESGFRANELRSLGAESFDFDADPPTVTVEAGYSKRRRRDTLPLRRDLADDLEAYLAGRPAGRPAFDVPQRTAEMLRADLSRAGIPVEDRSGRCLDFHGLRHTLATRLDAAGVSLTRAQDLMRHSDPRLTAKIYTHLVIADRSSAVESLPSTGAKRGRHRKGAAG